MFVVALATGMPETGQCSGLTAVPLLAFEFGPGESTGVMIPILIIADIYGVTHYPRMAEGKYILKLMPWSIPGNLAGVIIGIVISVNNFGICIARLIPEWYFRVFVTVMTLLSALFLLIK